MNKDFSLLQLLSSKLCHDLIGPVGSLSFSMEILKDEKEFKNKEVIDIALSGVTSLVNRLNFFRVAFGYANVGEKESGLLKAKELIFNLFQEKDCKIVWGKEIDEIVSNVADSDKLKLILNIFLVAFYTIQKATTLEVHAKDIQYGVGMAISVKGPSAKLGLDNIQALKMEISDKDLTPRNVQSYFTAVLAKKLNSVLEIKENMQDEIRIAFTLNG